MTPGVFLDTPLFMSPCDQLEMLDSQRLGGPPDRTQTWQEGSYTYGTGSHTDVIFGDEKSCLLLFFWFVFRRPFVMG